MNILCTNDDGIFARGIDLNIEVCTQVGDTVYVVAPDREQSGASHSLTLHRPLRVMPRGPGRWAIDGTPTDCAMLAIEQILPQRPDVLISGVNHGPNMGEDVLYSGTVAAAMEAVSLGVPAIAISFRGADLNVLATWKEPLVHLVSRLLQVLPPPPTFLNINLPACAGTEAKGVAITTLGSRVYEGSIRKMQDPWGRDVYWIGGGNINWKGDEKTDMHAVKEGWVSVTPLQLDLTHHASIEAVRALQLVL